MSDDWPIVYMDVDATEFKQLEMPLESDEITDKLVRPELNTSKFADFIFPPSHANNLYKSRSKEWNITLPDGTEGRASLKVSPPEGIKSPTHQTYKILLALFDLWHKKRSADGTLTCSLRDICSRLHIKMTGKAAQAVVKELDVIRGAYLSWKFSFTNNRGEGQSLRPMNILEDFQYDEWTPKEERFKSRVSIKFNKNIQRNLEANKTKPINLSVLRSIKGEIASVLYTRLDIILSTRDRYERNTKGVFSDLQIDSEKYRYPSRRKAKLTPIVKELNGKRLSTGHVLSLSLEKTVDHKDWKIVCTRGSMQIPREAVRSISPVNETDLAEYLAEEIGAVVGDLETHRKLYTMFARYYNQNLIYRAIGEYKETATADVHYPRRFFTAIVHRLAHEQGKEWIKPCGKDCKHRPENRLL
jgi:hypothetical protein